MCLLEVCLSQDVNELVGIIIEGINFVGYPKVIPLETFNVGHHEP